LKANKKTKIALPVFLRVQQNF